MLMEPIVTSLRPLVILSKALGLQTFTSVNRWWLQLLLVLGMAFLLWLQLAEPAEPKLEMFVFRLLLMAEVVLYPLCHLNSFLGHSRVQQLMTELRNIPPDQLSRFSRTTTAQLLGITCALSVWYMIAIFHYDNNNLVNILSSFILELTCVVPELEFLAIVLLLKIHLRNLNTRLLSRSAAQEHAQLLDLVIQTNQAYGCQILANLGLCFCTIVVAVFFAINTQAKQLPIILLWLAPYVFRPFWICYICFACTKEATRTATLIHKLINMTQDPNIRNELQMFSLQLLHRKVLFTAYNFFPLDFTLLYSIVGAVTTYVVFLIQFEISLDSQ